MKRKSSLEVGAAGFEPATRSLSPCRPDGTGYHCTTRPLRADNRTGQASGGGSGGEAHGHVAANDCGDSNGADARVGLVNGAPTLDDVRRAQALAKLRLMDIMLWAARLLDSVGRVQTSLQGSQYFICICELVLVVFLTG